MKYGKHHPPVRLSQWYCFFLFQAFGKNAFEKPVLK